MSEIPNDASQVKPLLAGDHHEPVTRIAAALAKTPRTKANADLRWYLQQQLKLARHVARMDRRLPPEATLRKRLAEAVALHEWQPRELYPKAHDLWTDQTWSVMDEHGAAPPRLLLDYRTRKLNEIVIERLSADLNLVEYRDACDDESKSEFSELGLFRGPQ
jgi:hypothetical protein